jgi:hypothetical protein
MAKHGRLPLTLGKQVRRRLRTASRGREVEKHNLFPWSDE